MNEPVEADKLFDPNGPDPATDPPLPESGVPETAGLGTFMRVAVGGAALALDAVRSAAEPQTADRPPASEAGTDPVGQQDQAGPALRHTLIGAAFAAGDQLDRQMAAALRRTRQVTSPPTRWARQSRPPRDF